MGYQGRLRSVALLLGAALALMALVGLPAAHAAAHKKKLTATPKPTVSGTAVVGRTLTAKPGTWKPAGVKLTYKWYAGATAIKGARSKTYLLAAAELGKKLTVAVTGSKRGYTSVTKRSKATAVVRSGTLTTAPRPTITGTPGVGLTLTAKPGIWKPSGVAFTYKWAAGGATIAGATKPTYKAVVGELGKPVTVSVTGSKAGYTPVTKTSAATGAVSTVVTGIGPALLECLDLQLDLPDGAAVTQAQLGSLTTLGCASFDITDISPLRYATGLTTLYLNGNQISDVSVLSSLPVLTELDLDTNPLSDLTPLASMTQLTALDLHADAISDVSPLMGLTHLTYLDLSGNQITDLSPVAGVISTDPFTAGALVLSGQAETLETASAGVPFTLPTVTSPTGTAEMLGIGPNTDTSGTVTDNAVTWDSPAGSDTGQVVWTDASVGYGSGQLATFSGTFTQPVSSGCNASSDGADC